MKLLSELDNLDNIKDGTTRILPTVITYSITFPTTSGGASDWQPVEGGYELEKTITGLTVYDSIVSVADDDTIWTTNELNATITTDTLTFFVSSLPISEVGLVFTITKASNGGTL